MVEISRVEAINEFTCTLAVGENFMPSELTKKSMPFAVSEPLILLACPPVTRLRTVELLEGWIKFTVSFWAMLKELKLMTALSLAVIFNVLGLGCSKVTLPDSTDCPSGRQ